MWVILLLFLEKEQVCVWTERGGGWACLLHGTFWNNEKLLCFLDGRFMATHTTDHKLFFLIETEELLWFVQRQQRVLLPATSEPQWQQLKTAPARSGLLHIRNWQWYKVWNFHETWERRTSENCSSVLRWMAPEEQRIMARFGWQIIHHPALNFHSHFFPWFCNFQFNNPTR